MKNIKICIILLLLFGFTSVFAQATQSGKTENAGVANLPADPKFSPEEQALMLTAGEDNPAKIEEPLALDPKLSPEERERIMTAGEDNPAKIEDTLPEDPRHIAEPVQKVKQTAPNPGPQRSAGPDQPAGEKIGTIPDYRSMNGGNSQPQGDTPTDIPNYKEMKGSSHQPAGDVPNK